MSLVMTPATMKERESMGSSQCEETDWEDVHHVQSSNIQWRKNKLQDTTQHRRATFLQQGRTAKPTPAAMPPSASAAPTLAENDGNHRVPPETQQQGSDSDAGSINDDEEEIEVEEDDVEEDSPGSSHGSDISNIMESNRKGRKQGSVSSIQERCGTVLPSSRLAMGDNSGGSKFSGLPTEFLRTQKEDQSINFKLSKYPTSAVSEKDAAGRSHLCVGGIMDRAANSMPIRYHSGEVVNGIPCFGEENQRMDMQSADDRKRMASRSAASDMRTEVLSPGVDFNNDSKRPAIICDFFARGWCIKGSSCRFLHIRDNENVAGQEGGSTSADRQQVLQLDEGLRNAMRTPPVFKQHSSSRDDLRSFRDVRRESEGQNLPGDDYMKSSSLFNIGSSPVFRSSVLSECRSSSNGLVISSDNCQSRNQSSHKSSLEELAHRSYYRLNSHSSLGLGHFLTSSFSNSFPSIGISPSCHASTWIGSSPFHSSSLTSEAENPPITNLAADPLRFADYKATISSDDWEPSLPFRPSFFIIPSTSSPQSQYDPLCDGIDLPKIGDRDFKFSFSAPGVSVLNATHQQTYGDSTSTGTPVPECNGDNSTTLNRIQEDVLNHNCYTSGKYSLASDAKTEGTSVVDIQIETLVKDENSSDASHVKGISKKSTVDKDLDGRHQSDGSRCRKDLKVDRSIQNNEIVVEQKLDGDVQIESKAARLFRAALIDFVKEMLRPTWQEGHLSKDAHNTIVKKAVDKVLSSFQPHQIPVTMDSAKQYLSTCQPKIAKLIKGYVGRYGKS